MTAENHGNTVQSVCRKINGLWCTRIWLSQPRSASHTFLVSRKAYRLLTSTICKIVKRYAKSFSGRIWLYDKYCPFCQLIRPTIFKRYLKDSGDIRINFFLGSNDLHSETVPKHCKKLFEYKLKLRHCEGICIYKYLHLQELPITSLTEKVFYLTNYTQNAITRRTNFP